MSGTAVLGMNGAGKLTVGKALEKALGEPFIVSDGTRSVSETVEYLINTLKRLQM